MWTKLDGKQFGRLRVIGRAETPPGQKHHRFWRCQCECGKETVVRTSMLNSGQTKSCGCLSEETRHPNLVGQVFGRLTVKAEAGVAKYGTRWLCACLCGKEVTALTFTLRNGNVKSCGCLQKERTSKAHRLALGEANRNRVLAIYKANAAKKGMVFSLTDEEAFQLFRSHCHYCGSPPSQTASKVGSFGAFLYNGIDRKNNRDGYTRTNSLPCCKLCNKIKSAMPYDEFIGWIQKTSTHLRINGTTEHHSVLPRR